jgi:recombination protein RecR
LEDLERLPGVGPKSAQRIAFFLLQRPKEELEKFATDLLALSATKTCTACGMLTEGDTCSICRDAQREQSTICVVETPVDVLAIERTGEYQGLYHVLGGTVHPLDSTAPAKLHLRELFGRVQELAASAPAPFSNSQELERKAAGAARGTVEVILATNPTAEGDATALYLERILTRLKNQYPALKVSRLGRGLTTGSELEYSDDITIANALQNRK